MTTNQNNMTSSIDYFLIEIGPDKLCKTPGDALGERLALHNLSILNYSSPGIYESNLFEAKPELLRADDAGMLESEIEDMLQNCIYQREEFIRDIINMLLNGQLHESILMEASDYCNKRLKTLADTQSEPEIISYVLNHKITHNKEAYQRAQQDILEINKQFKKEQPIME